MQEWEILIEIIHGSEIFVNWCVKQWACFLDFTINSLELEQHLLSGYIQNITKDEKWNVQISFWGIAEIIASQNMDALE